MNTNQVRKLVSKKIDQLIDRLEAAKTELGSWEPGEEDGWLNEELAEVMTQLNSLMETIDDNSFDVDDEDEEVGDEDEDEEVDDVEELGDRLGFDDFSEDE